MTFDYFLLLLFLAIAAVCFIGEGVLFLYSFCIFLSRPTDEATRASTVAA